MKSKRSLSGKKNSKNIIIIFSAVLVVFSFLAAVKFLSQVVYEHYDNEMIVCIDAGHGGSDSGATSTDGKRLEKNDPDDVTYDYEDGWKDMMDAVQDDIRSRVEKLKNR